MESMTREAYRLINRLSGQFELQIFEQAARLAQAQGESAIEVEHVNVALQELAGDNPSLRRIFSDSGGANHVERRAG